MACHEENPYAKFFGACNDLKMALDKCFVVSQSPAVSIGFMTGREGRGTSEETAGNIEVFVPVVLCT